MASKRQNANLTDSSRIAIAGIGASAGGIEALREFFDVLPDDLGLAYVVVVHLAPHHESELASILARRTRMSVVEVDDNKKLELKANCVYVIAPDRKLVISEGKVGAGPFEEPPASRSSRRVAPSSRRSSGRRPQHRRGRRDCAQAHLRARTIAHWARFLARQARNDPAQDRAADAAQPPAGPRELSLAIAREPGGDLEPLR